MAIDVKYIQKYHEAYKDLSAIENAIEFMPNSPYYRSEEWREVVQRYIPNVKEGIYFISNHGRVYTKMKSTTYPNGGIMAHSINQKGYHQINLTGINGIRKIGCKIARLVMLHFAFIPGCEYLEVDHVDGNKDNNYLWNLEWVTPQENTFRAIKNELRTISCTVNRHGVVLTDNEARILFMRALNADKSEIFRLSLDYGVSVQYIEYLINGIIRPYLAGKYDNQPSGLL